MTNEPERLRQSGRFDRVIGWRQKSVVAHGARVQTRIIDREVEHIGRALDPLLARSHPWCHDGAIKMEQDLLPMRSMVKATECVLQTARGIELKPDSDFLSHCFTALPVSIGKGPVLPENIS